MNELKQKASEFYAREIWQADELINVYMSPRDNLFTKNEGHIFIGKYDRTTTSETFFTDVIQRLREYTKDYAIRTSLQNVVMDNE